MPEKIPPKGEKCVKYYEEKKPPKQTQTSLASEKWSLLFTNHFNLSKIKQKNTFISETGAQGLILWGGEGGKSQSLRNQGDFYKFYASRCQT